MALERKYYLMSFLPVDYMHHEFSASFLAHTHITQLFDVSFLVHVKNKLITHSPFFTWIAL